MLLRGLPSEAAYVTAVRNALTDEQLDEITAAASGKHGPWSHTDHLLAHVYDSIERLAFIQVARAGVKGAKQPTPMSRPGLRTTPAPVLGDKAIAYLEEIRARHREAEAGG